MIGISSLLHPTDKNGVPVVSSGDEYNNTVNKADAIFKRVISDKLDVGIPLSAQDQNAAEPRLGCRH